MSLQWLVYDTNMKIYPNVSVVDWAIPSESVLHYLGWWQWNKTRCDATYFCYFEADCLANPANHFLIFKTMSLVLNAVMKQQNCEKFLMRKWAPSWSALSDRKHWEKSGAKTALPWSLFFKLCLFGGRWSWVTYQETVMKRLHFFLAEPTVATLFQ